MTRRRVLNAAPESAERMQRRLSHHEIVEGMRALRKRVKMGAMTEMVNAGRRLPCMARDSETTFLLEYGGIESGVAEPEAERHWF